VLCAEYSFLEGYLQIVPQIRAAAGTLCGPTRRAKTEEILKDVLKAGKAKPKAARTGLLLHSSMTVAIVLCAELVIAEYLVRLVDLLKALLSV